MTPLIDWNIFYELPGHANYLIDIVWLVRYNIEATKIVTDPKTKCFSTRRILVSHCVAGSSTLVAILTGFEALAQAREVGRAAGHAVHAHLEDAAPLHLAHARADYERDVALFASKTQTITNTDYTRYIFNEQVFLVLSQNKDTFFSLLINKLYYEIFCR